MELLIARSDIDMNLGDKNGNTVLHLALERNFISIAELLMSRPDVKVNLKNNYGITALHLAAEKDSISIAELLISRSSDIDLNMTDSHGKTALHLAASNWTGMLQPLLENPDVDANLRDKLNRTPLLTAVILGNISSMRSLLECDRVDVNCKDSEGMTPLAHAMRGELEAVELLCAHQNINLDPTDNTGRDLLALVKKREAEISGYDDEWRASLSASLEKCLETLRTARESRL